MSTSIDLEAVRLAMEHAPNEQAAMALVKTFLDTVATAFPVDADPVVVLTTIFGIESVAEVAEVGAAAVAALDAEAVATGGAITDRAAGRTARGERRRSSRRSRSCPRRERRACSTKSAASSARSCSGRRRRSHRPRMCLVRFQC